MSRLERRALRELDRQAIAHSTIGQRQLRLVIRIDADRWKQNRDGGARAHHCAQSNTTIRPGREVAWTTACEIVTHANQLLAQLGLADSPAVAATAKRRPGRPLKPAADEGTSSAAVSGKRKMRTMSAEARARISAAQKARWAKPKRAAAKG